MVHLPLIASVIGYLLGSLPVGYLVGRLHGIDVRDHGSGNVGTTNILRLLGLKWAVGVLLLDAGKGYLACALAAWLGLGPEFIALVGIIAIAGHNWSIFLGFRGGKGAATTAGVFLYVTPIALALGLAIAALLWITTRYMSLGVIVGVGIGALWAVLFSAYPLAYRGATVIAFAWILIRHRDNIVRLVKGEERRLGQKEHYRGSEK